MSSVRLEPHLKEKIRQVASTKGITLSDVHRLALERYCEQELEQPQTRRSRYSDIIGVGEGPSDLSSRTSEAFAEILEEKYGRRGDRHPD